jgi:hypothetical protein
MRVCQKNIIAKKNCVIFEKLAKLLRNKIKKLKYILGSQPGTLYFDASATVLFNSFVGNQWGRDQHYNERRSSSINQANKLSSRRQVDENNRNVLG